MLVSIQITNLNAVVYDHQLKIIVAAIIMGGVYTLFNVILLTIKLLRDKVNEATYNDC